MTEQYPPTEISEQLVSQLVLSPEEEARLALLNGFRSSLRQKGENFGDIASTLYGREKYSPLMLDYLYQEHDKIDVPTSHQESELSVPKEVVVGRLRQYYAGLEEKPKTYRLMRPLFMSYGQKHYAHYPIMILAS